MSNLFGKKKVSKDQNLIPQSMISNYILKKTVTPALVIVIVVIAFAVAITYIIPQYIETIRQETILLESQSLVEDNEMLSVRLAEINAEIAALQQEYNDYYVNHPVVADVDNSILGKIQEQINALKAELAELEKEALKADEKESFTRYPMHMLSDYIDSIRTDDIVIISLEDIVSQTGSGNSEGVVTVTDQNSEEVPFEPVEEENTSSDDAVTVPPTNVSSGYLEYKEDIGNVKIILRGFAHDSKALAEFATLLNDCEMLASTSILSIETQTVEKDVLIYVFEIEMIPVESVVER